MDYRETYQSWLDDPLVDVDTKAELWRLADNTEELKERFSRNLEFGTAGLRGILGAGTNRMNRYTVGMATQGLANYICNQGPEAMARGVAIAHDCRRMSPEFTQEAALEILLVTTRQSRQWIIPKGWPIKGLRPAKSAAREAFEEAGVRGRVGGKSIGLFAYNKTLDGNGIRVSCEVRVFPLLVRRQIQI